MLCVCAGVAHIRIVVSNDPHCARREHDSSVVRCVSTFSLSLRTRAIKFIRKNNHDDVSSVRS